MAGGRAGENVDTALERLVKEVKNRRRYEDHMIAREPKPCLLRDI